MKFILIPDSFKGTMSSQTIIEIMRSVIVQYYADADVLGVPIADGGEGTVDAMLASRPGQKITLRTKGPTGEEVDSFYGLFEDGTAVIEIAAAAGLPQMHGQLDVLHATSYGGGELIYDAVVRKGARSVIIGLGGSATHDVGCGLAAALGVDFRDRQGRSFVPVGATLAEVDRIDLSRLDPRIGQTRFQAMCDIDNPLCGEHGAAAVFSPQKGATPEIVARLDAGSAHLAAVMERDLGRNVLDLPGSGAAGGMGAGLVGFFDAELRMGIQVLLDTIDFENMLRDTDYVFTGEGKIDRQSLRGKVVIGVAQRCRRQNVPVVAVVGDIGDRIDEAYGLGVSAIFSINQVAIPFREARQRAPEDLRKTIDNILRLLATAETEKGTEHS